ncbi:hypothetical protein TMatcc_004932 [Talaromyces marneffei ATCC 18224]|nr:hypothetical protein EYB25_002185 [Talaromyces marneffei]
MAHQGHHYGYPYYPNQQSYRYGFMPGNGDYNNPEPQPSESPEPGTDREPWGNRSSNGMSETHFDGMVPSQQLSPTADFNDRFWYQQSNPLANQYLTPEATPRSHSGRIQQHRYSLDRGLERKWKRMSRDYFTPGRIFLMRWIENAGQTDGTRSGNSEIITDGHGNSYFCTPRRMIVLSTIPGSNSSTCVGIYTYGGQGLAKHGIHVESHAVLYDEAGVGPQMSRGEPAVERTPLAVTLNSSSERLDYMSRANFGDLHTVQHNVKICHIGKISADSMPTFHAYVNERFTAILK